MSSVDFDKRNEQGLIEKPSDFGTAPEDQVAYWVAQDGVAEKKERVWIRRSRKIVQRYRDDRGAALANTHRYNVLWSNVQTIRPALYSRTPKPDIERRFHDADPIGRVAATILERCCNDALDRCDFDSQMQSVLDDYLLPGRGVMRVLYVPHFGEPIPEDTEAPDSEAPDEGGLEVTGESAAVEGAGDTEKGNSSEPLREVVFEEARLQYVFWEDYREGPARKWGEVPWVKYKAYLQRNELVDRFGAKGKKVNLDSTPHNEYARSDDGDQMESLFKKAEVWEIWDKSRKRAIWLAPGSPELGFLDEKPDPLRLPNFFPNPDPVLATTTNDQRIPVPDYVEYQDQAQELDVITARIDRLVKALKVSGVYAGEEKQALQQLLDEGMENRLVAVPDWQAMTDKGGLAGIIEWLPIQTIASTLIELYNARDRCKQVLYEITGMSDIMRGSTSPVETATAQQLKAQFGTLRLSDRQRAVAKFAKECIRLVCYVVGQHFSPETITMMTGLPELKTVPAQPQGPQAVFDGQTGQMVPSPQMAAWLAQAQPIMEANEQAKQQFMQACDLLRDEVLTGFRIDIEADSTVVADEQEEKASATEFLGALLPLMKQVVPIAQGNPAFAGLAKEMIMFAVRRFKAGRPLESALDKAFDTLAQQPPPQAPGAEVKPEAQPDPAEHALAAADIQAKSQAAQINAGIAQQKNSMDFHIAQEKNQIDAGYKSASLQLQERAQAAKEAKDAADVINAERQAAARIA